MSENNERIAALESTVKIGFENVMNAINEMKQTQKENNEALNGKHRDHYKCCQQHAIQMENLKGQTEANDRHIKGLYAQFKGRWNWVGVVGGLVGIASGAAAVAAAFK